MVIGHLRIFSPVTEYQGAICFFNFHRHTKRQAVTRGVLHFLVQRFFTKVFAVQRFFLKVFAVQSIRGIFISEIVIAFHAFAVCFSEK